MLKKFLEKITRQTIITLKECKWASMFGTVKTYPRNNEFIVTTFRDSKHFYTRCKESGLFCKFYQYDISDIKEYKQFTLFNLKGVPCVIYFTPKITKDKFHEHAHLFKTSRIFTKRRQIYSGHPLTSVLK